jgi:hypothetical protein
MQEGLSHEKALGTMEKSISSGSLSAAFPSTRVVCLPDISALRSVKKKLKSAPERAIF